MRYHSFYVNLILLLSSIVLSNKIYFPSLNGIRFIAAFVVMISHTFPLVQDFGFDTSFIMPDLGGLGVTLFFVLSGFLITFLLFTEKQQTHKIKTGSFIVRRILRIWPAYFLALGIGFFIFPYLDAHTHEFTQTYPWLKLGLFALFLGDFVKAIIFDAGVINHLWSVGVEEQFYLIWPFLMNWFSSKFLKMAIIIIVINILLRLGFAQWSNFHPLTEFNKTSWMICEAISKFFVWFRVDCMAIGGLGAYFIIEKKERVLAFLYQKSIQITSYILLFLLLCFGITFGFITHDIYGILFLILILNVSSNTSSVLNLEFSWLNRLGSISYGLYLYHPFIYFLIYYFYKQGWGTGSSILDLILFYPIFISGTILFSWLSYHYYESYFLRIKQKFTIIPSGDDAHELISETNKE